jgi:hypothetical protein
MAGVPRTYDDKDEMRETVLGGYTPDQEVKVMMGKGKGSFYWKTQLALFFAPIKPVRLDPR